MRKAQAAKAELSRRKQTLPHLNANDRGPASALKIRTGEGSRDGDNEG